MIAAHVGPIPLEEMLPLLPGAGAFLMLARAWVTLRLRSSSRTRAGVKRL